MLIKEFIRRIFYVFYHSKAKAYLSRYLADSRFIYLQRGAQRIIHNFKRMDKEASGVLRSDTTAKLKHVESLISLYLSDIHGGSDRKMMYLPKISIVTPNYNKGRFLEGCIHSVLSQEYPNLELIIIDGGSNDNSVEIIKKYADRITWWASEKDNGQADAINKGLKHATGEIFNWLNSDDRLAPGALFRCAEAYNNSPAEAGWIGGCVRTNEKGYIAGIIYPNGAYREHIGENWNGRQFYQPSCFLSTEKVREIGGLNPDLYIALDLDLWIRILAKGKFEVGKGIWSIAINHEDAKTQKSIEKMFLETAALQKRYGFIEGAESRLECVKGKSFEYVVPAFLRQRIAEVSGSSNNIIDHSFAPNRRKNICFVGNFDSEQDIEAVRYFLREIFPVILENNWIEFHVIGHNAERCRKLFKLYNVRFFGPVRNIEEVLMNYKLFVSPMTLQGGLQGKCVLAASAGLPVVSTSIGTEGLPVKDGEECFIADHPVEFAIKCEQVLNDAICWKNFSLKSLLMLAEKYGQPSA